jgi:hypothetical protein
MKEAPLSPAAGSRRNVLLSGLMVTVAAGLPVAAFAPRQDPS